MDLRENPATLNGVVTSLILEITDDAWTCHERRGHVLREDIYIFGHSLKLANLAEFFTTRQAIKVVLAPDQEKRFIKAKERGQR